MLRINGSFFHAFPQGCAIIMKHRVLPPEHVRALAFCGYCVKRQPFLCLRPSLAAFMRSPFWHSRARAGLEKASLAAHFACSFSRPRCWPKARRKALSAGSGVPALGRIFHSWRKAPAYSQALLPKNLANNCHSYCRN